MVIRNQCSSDAEGLPSRCNLCRISDRQRQVCRTGPASASRPTVGPTSHPLKTKSVRVRNDAPSSFSHQIQSTSKWLQRFEMRARPSEKKMRYDHVSFDLCTASHRFQIYRVAEKRKWMANGGRRIPVEHDDN